MTGASDTLADPPEPRRVCVTGASGFLASHTIALLLERGHEVRGTVRSLAPERTSHLRTLAEGRVGQLELVTGDLLTPGSFDTALEGCDALMHMASPVVLRSPNPERDLIEPAVDGTKNVLGSIGRSSTPIDTVVLTSSIAAIRDDQRPVSHLLTEADWNETASLGVDPYSLSKTLAERAAWQHQDAQAADHRYRLCTINPTIVLGPVFTPAHAEGSVAIVAEMLRGKIPAVPRLSISIVDARDVAVAHVRALERPEAQGRHILFSEARWMRELADMIRPAYPMHKVPRLNAPNWSMYIAAMFDKRLSAAYLRRRLGIQRRIDNTKARRDLDIDFRPVEQSVLDTCKSLVALGLAGSPRT